MSSESPTQPGNPTSPDFPDTRRTRPNTAGSADSVPRKTRKRPPEIPIPNEGGDPALVWNEYFSTHRPDASAVADLAARLHREKRLDDVIACIEAALVHGQSQPWMYTVLALTMERAGRPRDQIERVLLSQVDYSAVNMANLLYSAAFLTRFGAHAQALALYRQASAVDPTRLEPYVLGMKLAREANDPLAVEWAVTGILQRAWTENYEDLHRDAESTARDMELALRKAGRMVEADRLLAALTDALSRDLVVELAWSGKSDLDLRIEDPSGVVCSFDNRRTHTGGVLVHDGIAADQKEGLERFVCGVARAGDYKITVRHNWGDVVGKRAVLRIIRYQGTSREIVDRFTVAIAERDKVVRITLHEGRGNDGKPFAFLDAVPRQKDIAGKEIQGARRREVAERRNGAARREAAEFARDRQGRSGARGGQEVGYQPIITVLNEGTMLTALAVISGDRRYVRMSLAPVFSTITDVQTFSFINTGNPNGGGQQQGQGQGQPGAAAGGGNR